MADPPKPQTDAQVVRSLDKLLKKREELYALANAIYGNSKKIKKESAQFFQAQLQHLDKIEGEFERVQNEIMTLNSALQETSYAVETTKVSLSFYELVWGTRGNAQIHKIKPVEENLSAAPPTSSALPLAPMQIPTFDGKISSWSEFKALFEQLIHNNPSITDVQKFYYLKTLVTGEAGKVISNLELSAANYLIAYSALEKRYASQRRVANKYMCELLHFRSTYKESDYLSVHENAIKGLKAMQISDLADYVLFRISYENLSPKMKYLFDDRCGSQRVPTCQELFDCVLHHTQNSELRLDAQVTTKSYPRLESKRTFFTRKETQDNTRKVNDFKGKKTICCPVCNGEHLIYSCAEFLKLNVLERMNTIKRLERCMNCLGQHNVRRCLSKKTCSKCNQSHHSFLHLDSNSESDKEPMQSNPRCHFLNAETSSVVILGTFVAQIQDCEGEYHPVRCVMDPASHISAVTKQLARKLGMKPQAVECSISGLANSTARAIGKLNVSLRSCLKEQKLFRFSAYVFPKICEELPSQNITPLSQLNHLQDLNLADPFFDQPGPVDLLLSAEMSAAILSSQTPNLIVGQPTAIRTVFGWILYGSIPVASNHPQLGSQSLFTLQESLHKFWEVEEIPERTFVSPEDEWCESHFSKTHSRDETGRYIVSLPFRMDRPPLGNNREFSMKRWLNLEKKLAVSIETKESYDAVLQEYLDKNHMEVARTPSDYILPHHGVTKVSTTTKLRVVFDASARDSLGLSLNDRLLIGPKLQRDITSIILSFRSFRFALCGDISQMYRMIWLQPSDRACQHIFWRRSLMTDVSEFELRTLTFGLAPAPFLAQRVLHQLVEDEGQKYELASPVLKHHTYVDDIITGVDSIEEGQSLKTQLIELLAKGGFHLRKWSSNTPELLQDVPPEDLETPLEFQDGSHGLKVLGLYWNPHLDVFTYQVRPFDGRITKRTILSFVARIYDPMGWLAPVIVVAKSFLQKLWLLKLDWDTDLPKPLRDQWAFFSRQFGSLCRIKIPRNLNSSPNKAHHRYKLIGFCDASETAYAACVYLQNLDSDNSTLLLLQAKTKVAPLKTMTIACLELCGALLLIRLVKSMRCPFPIEESLYFTDSQIVLTWLQTPLHKLKIFVANRVSQILTDSKFSQWRHIPGTWNPADVASRGLQPEELPQSSLWWSGPQEVPTEDDFIPLSMSETPELKKVQEGKSFLVSDPTNDFINIFEKFSSWTRLQRIVAWILRFSHNCRFPTNRHQENWLTAYEHKQARQFIVRLTQRHYFSDKILEIQNGHTPRSFLSLHPFLDPSGCLRVGGRLRHSHLGYDSKFPLLIPKVAHIAVLIIRHYHENSLHSGPSTVQALIQQTFWIPSLRNLVKKHIFQCISCHRLRASSVQPKMGDLPSERVTMSRPFTRTATDFAGPFLIKESTRRNARLLKCYLCIFVCMSTKAVHLELVSSLTTEAFLATFTRFSSRRGLPALVLSDNGRNFVGASRELKELQKWFEANQDQIGASLATKTVNWKFNPPEAPHFGGLFEAAIKSTKSLLIRVVGRHSLTFEELTTLFARIEAVLNSRPITRLSCDPAEDYLSPAHFLVGGLLHQVPEGPVDDLPATTRWKRVQQLAQQFWKRWSVQYLQLLIPRSKWQKEGVNLKVGDLVYVKGQVTSPLTWPLGRVTEIFPGPDGIVRVASVRTSAGSYIRPANKLLPLPMEE